MGIYILIEKIIIIIIIVFGGCFKKEYSIVFYMLVIDIIIEVILYENGLYMCYIRFSCLVFDSKYFLLFGFQFIKNMIL